MKKIILNSFLILFSMATFPPSLKAAPVSHDIFNALLKKHVSDNGNVNYKGFIKDSVQLNKYLSQLSQNPPQQLSKNDQLAYWINAYNAFTIQLIIRHYPLSSIKDIGSKIKIPFVNTPWDVKFIKIGKEILDLNKIEHGILREKFNEPRIHFAIVCASVSCPKLLNEAYIGAKVDKQLESQAISFLNDPNRNKVTANKAELSKIFSWFKGDFTKKGSLTDFVNKYSKTKLNKNASIGFLDYNWNLNE